MAVEQVAEFRILAEHVEALVPAEPLELGRVLAGGERAAFAAPTEPIFRADSDRSCPAIRAFPG
jgi:hypothetical protein